ncbi:MAG TPA: alanine racemase, partial [Allosphingosinicella sp.]|nr:alanine racemase [Allosphingosinicella sp.]
MTLSDLETPALLLDREKMQANVDRMNAALKRHGVDLRPHVKTAKAREPVEAMTCGWSGAVTVSTLKEAEQFFDAGYRDVLYAVGIAPNKLARAAGLLQRGARLTLILDSLEAARAVAEHGRSAGLVFPVMIEVDSDRHRAGVDPDDARKLVAIGRELAEAGGAELSGVMTHGGGSYNVTGDEA